MDSDLGWQMRQHELNLTLAAPHFASPAQRLDAIVFKVLGPEFVGLDLRRPSAITADWPLVRSPTPVLLAIVTYIVTVWLWSSSIRRAASSRALTTPNGCKPSSSFTIPSSVLSASTWASASSPKLAATSIVTHPPHSAATRNPVLISIIPLCHSQSRAHLYCVLIRRYSLWGNHGGDDQAKVRANSAFLYPQDSISSNNLNILSFLLLTDSDCACSWDSTSIFFMFRSCTSSWTR